MKYNNDRLKQRRNVAGLSQSGLASAAGVSLRALQYYEQGRDDINKSQVGTIYKLATALGCKIEDVIEPERLTE